MVASIEESAHNPHASFGPGYMLITPACSKYIVEMQCIHSMSGAAFMAMS